MDELSPREREVLALMAQGLSNLAITIQLSLAPRTVESHVRQVLRQVGGPDDGLHDRRVVAVLAYLEVASAVDVR